MIQLGEGATPLSAEPGEHPLSATPEAHVRVRYDWVDNHGRVPSRAHTAAADKFTSGEPSGCVVASKKAIPAPGNICM